MTSTPGRSSLCECFPKACWPVWALRIENAVAHKILAGNRRYRTHTVLHALGVKFFRQPGEVPALLVKPVRHSRAPA